MRSNRTQEMIAAKKCHFVRGRFVHTRAECIPWSLHAKEHSKYSVKLIIAALKSYNI